MDCTAVWGDHPGLTNTLEEGKQVPMQIHRDDTGTGPCSR